MCGPLERYREMVGASLLHSVVQLAFAARSFNGVRVLRGRFAHRLGVNPTGRSGSAQCPQQERGEVARLHALLTIGCVPRERQGNA